MKNFCSQEDTVKKIKRKDIHWEKTFVNHISDRELAFIIYKGLSKFNS